jgi:3-phosphoshikimate 1-carboxyvinyltransferase
MRERPIGALTNALKMLGVKVEFAGKPGFPPVRLQGPETLNSNRVYVDAKISSQFASGLLLVAPRINGGLLVNISNNAVSIPYIDLTLQMLSEFKCKFSRKSDCEFLVENSQPHRDNPFTVETDWSSAAFILAAAHIAKKEIAIPNLVRNSKQGDSRFAVFLENMKSLDGRQLDLTHTPDLIAPLSALAVFATGSTHIVGAAHTRAKECDRISVLAHALRSVGCNVAEQPDGMMIIPPSHTDSVPIPTTLNAHNDHRMAMAFALLSLGGLPVNIEGSESVSKSFPNFWECLDEIRKA